MFLDILEAWLLDIALNFDAVPILPLEADDIIAEDIGRLEVGRDKSISDCQIKLKLETQRWNCFLFVCPFSLLLAMAKSIFIYVGIALLSNDMYKVLHNAQCSLPLDETNFLRDNPNLINLYHLFRAAR